MSRCCREKERSDRFTLPFDKDGLAGFERSSQFVRTCQFGDQLHHATLSPPTRDTSGPPDYEESL
jgi:hypothetical protein